ncbi:MAG: hypothetical protein ACREAA_07160 [Candidatus Polarisedimenticolia bacterium]
MRCFSLALLLLAVSSDPASAIQSCLSCQTNCNEQSFLCYDNAATAYEGCQTSCHDQHPDDPGAEMICNEVCFIQFNQARNVCTTKWQQCRQRCVPPTCSDGGSPEEPSEDPDDPSDDPEPPIEFGPKEPNDISRPRLDVRTETREARTLEFRMSLEEYETGGGLDLPLPEGFSEVVVDVLFLPRPSDLLGSLVKFARTTGARTHDVRRYRNASRTALAPFETGQYRITGNMLRVEPVISGAAPGGEFEIRLTLIP